MRSVSFRIVAITVATAYVSLGTAQTELPKVKLTYTNPGASVSTVLQEISQQTQINLSAAAPFRELPLVIQVNEVPLSELMQKIAEVTHAGWSEGRKGFTLQRSREVETKDAEDERQRRIKYWQKVVDDWKANDKPAQAFGNQEAELLMKQFEGTAQIENQASIVAVADLRSKTPLKRLMSALMRTLTAETLSDVDSEHRVVFALKPNKHQRAFSNEAQTALAAFEKEQALWSKLAQRSLLNSKMSVEARAALQQTGVSLNDVLKPIFSVSYVSFSGSFRLQVLYVDPLGIDWIAYSEEIFPPNPYPQNTPQASQNQELSIEFTPFAKEFAERLEFRKNPNATWQEPSAEFLDKVLHTEKFEPLGLASGQIILQLAGKLNRPLVACPPDYVIAAAGYIANSKLDWKLIAVSMFGQEMIDDPSRWLTMSFASNSSQSMPQRPMSRSLMGKMLRQIYEDQRITLATRVKIAQEENAVDTVVDTMARLITTAIHADSFMNETASVALFRLHGSWTVGQYDTLESGADLRAFNLSPNQQKEVLRILYAGQAVNNYSLPPNVQTEGPRYTMNAEPTEICPDGLTAEFFVRCKVEKNDGVIVRQMANDKFIFERTLSASALAAEMARETEGSTRLNGAQVLGYRLATTKNYIYILSYRPGAFCGRSFGDTTPKGDWVKKFGDLPESLTKEVNQLVQDIRRGGGGS